MSNLGGVGRLSGVRSDFGKTYHLQPKAPPFSCEHLLCAQRLIKVRPLSALAQPVGPNGYVCDFHGRGKCKVGRENRTVDDMGHPYWNLDLALCLRS